MAIPEFLRGLPRRPCGAPRNDNVKDVEQEDPGQGHPLRNQADNPVGCNRAQRVAPLRQKREDCFVTSGTRLSQKLLLLADKSQADYQGVGVPARAHLVKLLKDLHLTHYMV